MMTILPWRAATAALLPLAAGAPTAVASTPAQPAIAPVIGCDALAGVDFTTVADAPTRILSAEVTTAETGEFCSLTGYVAPQTQFSVDLPTSTWTGRYVQKGCGGLCGSVLPGDPAVSTGCAAVQNGELAISSNNGGHLGATVFDGAWALDSARLQSEFGHASQHRVALAAEAIIEAYYGRAPAFSYFDGCSNGGRQALVEAQRYPDDFDGILAGAPVIDAAPYAGLFEPWVVRTNTDASGAQVLGVDKLPALYAAVLAACAGPEGLVADPRDCAFDPATIECAAGSGATDCLSAEQVEVARSLYRGPVAADGTPLWSGGLPYGSELAWAGWNIAPPGDDGSAHVEQTIAYQLGHNVRTYILGYAAGEGAPFADVALDSTARESLVTADVEFSANDPDLGDFAAAGGRIILYHGWADQAIPPSGTVDYYASLVEAAGDFTASQEFSRLYMIPGQYHCLTIGGGAPQVAADLLTPLFQWVEEGVPPGDVELPVLPDQDTALTSIVVDPFDPT